MVLHHSVKSFQQLTVDELYALLRLRSEVFVVEQNCVYLDLDNRDNACHHLLLYADRQLVGYSRLIPAGLSYKEVAIGRVVIAPAWRKLGLGNVLMKLAIDHCHVLYGPVDIRISAQLYALRFYQSLGFKEDGDVYHEDGIEHMEMVNRA